MELHPIQSFKEASAPKKAAVVGGALAATAAVATGAAFLSGKKTIEADSFVNKAELTNDKGKAKIFAAIKQGFVNAKEKVASFFAGLKKTEEKVEPNKTEEAVDAAADSAVDTAANAAQ